MSNLILLFLCIALGALLRKGKILPENGHVALNAFVINISLAALCLFYIPKIEFDLKLIFPVAVAWLNIFFAILLFTFAGKKFGWNKSLIGAVIMCAGFGNTSFVGIPVISALYGNEGLKTVMLVDQPGSFVALSTVGIAVVNFYSGSHSSAGEILKKIIRFPPFITFLLAIFLNIFQFHVPEVLDDVLSKLGATTVPLALVSVGSQLRFESPGPYTKPLAVGLLFKLIIFPLIIFILYCLILKQNGEVIEISLMEAAMAPMITSAILASSHDLEPKLCNLFIGIGIPLSFLTLTLWYLVFQQL
ncbi:AEC family transporter [Chryseobacterium taklimakanense]|uniref:AEC family transporter n=1 Tax=Chryseobacterium taklimakanense TaxID=536441 RepID=A0A3G8WN94_9FLAO|nr:AEC family transporter [Chryseobacterium taklimakanense]AZI20947.1 AEC family transporter [Chryseobacterium taklimakanense]